MSGTPVALDVLFESATGKLAAPFRAPGLGTGSLSSARAGTERLTAPVCGRRQCPGTTSLASFEVLLPGGEALVW